MIRWQAPLIALQFLTRLPVHLPHAPEPDELGQSALYYPLVGVLIGAMLTLLAALIPQTVGSVAAALVLCVWIAITGGLHLDGLADSADAWAGGLGDAQRSLTIMKDPRCGAMAVATVAALLILKFAALDTVIAQHEWQALWLAPIMGRNAALLLLSGTPYVRPEGIGAALVEHLPGQIARVVVFGVSAGALLSAGARGPALLGILAVLFWLLRGLMMKRIGGATGDTTGALIELSETASLLAFL